ncbi:hypothetical protein OYC64_001199 [Pagothenia borchgrevinki]|uniref:G-protein coupled receptors family 1 profile domain-containing protein n=1 Tax=Pagothenia borchgrevinki TaxID=8213 RepID=A0ABD2G9W8_PAGBO
MSINSSSFDSLLLIYLDSTSSIVIRESSSATRNIVLLPLSVLVLYLGHQQWRQQRSFISTSHSDMIAVHAAVLELIWCFGAILFICGSSTHLLEMKRAGERITSITLYGESLFHVLTCLERYLAVVHPIIYLRLKHVQGVRIRNISIVCVWLLSLVWGFLTRLDKPPLAYITLMFFVTVALLVISFCSLSVLCVLIRPGPGDGERVDQSKQRAFYTVTAITAAPWFWLLGPTITNALCGVPLFTENLLCDDVIFSIV